MRVPRHSTEQGGIRTPASISPLEPKSMNCSRFCFDLLDQTLVVESDSPAILADLRQYFEDVTEASDRLKTNADLYVALTVDSELSDRDTPRLEVRTIPARALPMSLVREKGGGCVLGCAVVQWAIDSAPGHFVLHSGALALNGHGVLLPGASHSGKSTLTVALAQRGFEILSDEVGAIRVEDGSLTRFGRALSIRSDVLDELGIDQRLGLPGPGGTELMLRACSLQLTRGMRARPSLVVLPRYRASVETDLRPLRKSDAVVALYEASCSQRRWKVAGLDYVIDLAERLPCFRLTYSNMRDAAQRIDQTVVELCGSEPDRDLERFRSAQGQQL